MRVYLDIEDRQDGLVALVTVPGGPRAERPVAWAGSAVLDGAPGGRLLVARDAAVPDATALATAVDQGRASPEQLRRYGELLFEAAFGQPLWRELLGAAKARQPQRPGAAARPAVPGGGRPGAGDGRAGAGAGAALGVAARRQPRRRGAGHGGRRGRGLGRLNQVVGFSCAGGALLLSRASYLAAVTNATVFGDLVRSCYDLYRGDLLTHLGWPMPPTLTDERKLWAVLTKKLYRGDVDNAEEALLNAARQPPAAQPGTPPRCLCLPFRSRK